MQEPQVMEKTSRAAASLTRESSSELVNKWQTHMSTQQWTSGGEAGQNLQDDDAEETSECPDERRQVTEQTEDHSESQDHQGEKSIT